MNITNNSDFNKVSGNFIDISIKFLFKWLGILIKMLVDAIKSLISAALGK